MNTMLDILPDEILNIIFEEKKVLETATYNDFMLSFNIKVLRRKVKKSLYKDKVLIHYKPLNKFMMVSCEYARPKTLDELKEYIIQDLYDGLEALMDECEYAVHHEQQLKWGSTISYSTYCFNNTTVFNQIADMTLKKFCAWRRSCSQFRKLLGQERFEKFMAVREYKV